MTIEINTSVTGKVTGIKGFGAFVILPDGRSGLVHISEIAQGYVESVAEHLEVGQEVQVKVLDDRNGRVNLSIKRAMLRESRQTLPPELTFERKLKHFMEAAEDMQEQPRIERRKRGKSRGDYDDYEELD